MFYILITGICMAFLSAIFWCIEALPYVKAIKLLKKPSNNPFSQTIHAFKVIASLPKIWPLGLDIFCTVWLAGAFGFSGMIGSVIGLSVSNVISVFIMIVSRPVPQYQRAKLAY